MTKSLTSIADTVWKRMRIHINTAPRQLTVVYVGERHSGLRHKHTHRHLCLCLLLACASLTLSMGSTLRGAHVNGLKALVSRVGRLLDSSWVKAYS